MHLAPRLLLVAALTGSAASMLSGPARASAQERCASPSAASEILDPFAAMPRARSAAGPIGEIVVEIIDPFEDATVRAVTGRVRSEIVDPFVTSAMAARSEILDPWSS